MSNIGGFLVGLAALITAVLGVYTYLHRNDDNPAAAASRAASPEPATATRTPEQNHIDTISRNATQ